MNRFTYTSIGKFVAVGLAVAACLPIRARAEPTEADLVESIRAGRTLNTQLALGLRTYEETADELHDLLDQGDALLRKAARVERGPQPDEIREWNDAVDGVVSAIAQAKAAAVAATLKRTGQPNEQVAFDPWAGPDQECGYVPQLDQPVPTNWNFELPATELGRLPDLIPPKFRLAEVLGLGRNRLHAELDWISPQLMRRQIPVEWGLHVFANLHCTLIGRFTPVLDETAGQGTEPHPAFESFRVLIRAQGLMQVISTRTGNDLGNKRAYRAEHSDTIPLLRSGGAENPWWRENLAAASAERGWLLQPAAGQPADSQPNWLDAAIQRELASRQHKVAEAVRRDPAVLEALSMLEQLTTRILNQLQSQAGGHPVEGEGSASETLSSSLTEDFYPELTAAKLLVEAGELRPASLTRLTPLTIRALGEAHRDSWAAAADPSLRAHAKQLARTLDTLSRWTLP